MSRVAALLLLVPVFLPTAWWTARTWRYAAPEPLELIPLALAGLVVATRRAARPRPLDARPVALVVLLHAGCLVLDLPLASAVCAACAATLVVSPRLGRRVHVGLGALLLLAVPVVPLLRFVLAHPLQLATATLARAGLRVAGLAAEREGTVLVVDGARVAVDAPCSGVRLLWAGWLLAAVLCCARRAGNGRTTAVLAATLPLALLANGLRTACLTLAEHVGLHPPPLLHEIVGLAAHGLVVVPVVWWASRGRSACAA